MMKMMGVSMTLVDDKFWCNWCGGPIHPEEVCEVKNWKEHTGLNPANGRFSDWIYESSVYEWICCVNFEYQARLEGEHYARLDRLGIKG